MSRIRNTAELLEISCEKETPQIVRNICSTKKKNLHTAKTIWRSQQTVKTIQEA
jgi:hypothetical protein